jgi:hypothetical protein
MISGMTIGLAGAVLFFASLIAFVSMVPDRWIQRLFASGDDADNDDDEPTCGMIYDVNRLLAGAARDLEQLEARAEEFVRIHGYQPGTCEAETLEECIFSRRPYDEAIMKVIQIRRERHLNQ